MAVFNFTAAKDALVAYFNSSSAATVHALSPRPTAMDCENAMIEERANSVLGGVIAIDDVGCTNIKARMSGDNKFHTVDYSFILQIETTGDDRANSRDNVRRIISAVLEDLTGAGAFINTNRTVVFSCVWSDWQWVPTAQDSMVASAAIQLVLTIYRSP